MSRQVSPIASFIRKHFHLILLTAIVTVAAFYRIYQLSALPPGLHPDEAQLGLRALELLRGNLRAIYGAGDLASLVLIAIDAVFIKLFGNTVTVLHIGPALLGIAATIMTYLWMRTWFGKRAGLIAAFLMAVTPWSVTLTRAGFRAALVPFFVSTLLWLFTRGFQTAKRKWFVASGIIMGLGFYSYGAFKLIIVGLLVVGLAVFIWRRKFFKQWSASVGLSFLVASIMLIPLGIYGVTHVSQVKDSITKGTLLDTHESHGRVVDAVVKSAVSTALMFNVKGDDNYLYNYDSQPALNVFVGIMFILGILLCLSALGRPKYLAMLTLFLAMLMPALISANSTPNFARAIGALPLALGLATMGIGYMLDRWYATFPINSAARASGLGIIVVLLLLTGFQGFTQYFVSWANDAKTYIAYNEDTVGIGKFLLKKPFSGQRFVLINSQRDLVINYLAAGHDKARYRRIEPTDINALPIDGKPKQFLISEEFKDDAIRAFKLKFPGGRLSPYDGFDQTELYLVYEVNK